MTFRIQKRFIRCKTKDAFEATYKGHDIFIEREKARSDEPAGFYIIVRAPCGMYDYDGCWGDGENTIDQAIEEALVGSCLIERAEA
jgi:hypothetical protein